MATSELSQTLAQNINDKEDMKRGMSGGSVAPDYLLTPAERLKISDVNVVLKIEYPNDDAFILGHATQGILGTSTLGAGVSGTSSTVEVMRREWTWNTFNELNLGAKSPNVTISGGTIQLGA